MAVVQYNLFVALLLNNAIFYHIPKTGGMWIRQILKEAGIAHRELPCRKCAAKGSPAISGCCFHVNHHHAVLPEDGRRRFVFMFVRHPLTYYQSYWAFKVKTGWDMENPFDRRFAHENFQMFVRAVLREYPGWVTQTFGWFAGPEDSPVADFIGKQETLRLDLLRALRRAGENVDTDLLMHLIMPKNEISVLFEWQERCKYTPELKEAVLEAERGAMMRFGYW